ncbi:hypothetical protein N9A04_00670 [Rickettsiales bacterium]|nr:hypothetical protein [Rickettsiales bacterium]
MAKKSIHHTLYEITIRTADGLEFKTFTTIDLKGKVFNSDFQEANLPWNRQSVGASNSKDSSAQKYAKRQGASVNMTDLFGDILPAEGA